MIDGSKSGLCNGINLKTGRVGPPEYLRDVIERLTRLTVLWTGERSAAGFVQPLCWRPHFATNYAAPSRHIDFHPINPSSLGIWIPGRK
tara:strand:+ start:233 stop:499 length:267 start_codon:yes stop_codon:yes gene_type:complete